MGRLIDADALVKAMDKRYKEKSGIVQDNLAEGFMQMEKLIKEQPTAYDVEKVVAELEKHDDDCGCGKISVWDAIDIVKKGGAT